MASKFRNLIASEVRQQMMTSGSLNQGSNPPPSLQDLEVKMRLLASPNPRLPFWINVQFPWETKQQTVCWEKIIKQSKMPSVRSAWHEILSLSWSKPSFQSLLETDIYFGLNGAIAKTNRFFFSLAKWEVC